MKPTEELYQSLQVAYGHFNKTLFSDKLPAVIFTVQRQKGVLGYFAPDRWSSLSGSRCHEIAINPTHMGSSRLVEVLQTLVHEMVHCWQHCFGDASRGTYHNKEWAYKMIELGLQPTATGLPGGPITGQQMSDYPIENGAFIKSCYTLANENAFNIPWVDRRTTPKTLIQDNASATLADSYNQTIEQLFSDEKVTEILTTEYAALMPENTFVSMPQKERNKNTYQCPICSTKVWGKPDLNIICGDCDEEFESI
jgi:predicted SprT family Zn-dependent metalloprotease